MPTTITDPRATEQGTYIINIQFEDEDGTSFIPNEAYWTLLDADGDIVNDREEVEISDLATSIDIVLTDEDLVVVANTLDKRFLVIEGLYNSNQGDDLVFRDQAIFYIDRLKKASLKSL